MSSGSHTHAQRRGTQPWTTLVACAGAEFSAAVGATVPREICSVAMVQPEELANQELDVAVKLIKSVELDTTQQMPFRLHN